MPKTKIPQDNSMTESDKWREWGKKLAIGAITACLGGGAVAYGGSSKKEESADAKIQQEIVILQTKMEILSNEFSEFRSEMKGVSANVYKILGAVESKNKRSK